MFFLRRLKRKRILKELANDENISWLNFTIDSYKSIAVWHERTIDRLNILNKGY